MPNRDPVPAAAARLLQGARDSIVSSKAAYMRVKQQVNRKIAAPAIFNEAREALTPDRSTSPRIWEKVAGALGSARAFPLWDDLRTTLTPDSRLQLSVWQRVSRKMEPVYAHAVSWPIKFAAAMAVLLLAVRISPLLFLASPTIAEAPVTVVPTRGDVSILVGGLWQPLSEELHLQGPTTLQTRDGEATLILHDDAVIRLAAHTTMQLHDLSDRPASPEVTPTLSLQEGELWVLGLVPRHIEGIGIGTAQGRVIVHEGSANIAQNGRTQIEVWHRSATVARRGEQMQLIAGEEIVLSRTETPVVREMDPGRYDQTWVSANLARDAVHQREIAAMQQERRAASAGILPDSGLYKVKRLAESVDVLFSFSEEERARKIINHANTRLNEAAALISRGSGSDALKPLQEYRDTLVAVSGSGTNTAVDSLIEKEVIEEAVADVSASLPDDESYVLKQMVRETIEALPDSIDKPDTAAAQILDELSVVKRHVQEGELQTAKLELESIRPNFSMENGQHSLLSPEMREEVEAAISTVAAVLEEAMQVEQAATAETIDPPRVVRFRSPQTASSPVVQPRSETEIRETAQQIRNRIINIYNTHQGRATQFRLEVDRLGNDPDLEQILVHLKRLLPRQSFGEYVENELEKIAPRNGSGSGAIE